MGQGRIAIIGSNSFLAKSISRYLSQLGFEIAGFSRSDSNSNVNIHHKFDYPSKPVNFENLLEYDCIINAAGAGIQSTRKESIEEVYQINSFFPIEMLNTLDALNYRGKVITFGSYFEIGFNERDDLFSEDDVVAVTAGVPNAYCSSKRLLTRFISNQTLSIEYYHLILPNIYGVGENENRLLPYLVNSLKAGKDVNLTSGLQVRQYIHVDDISRLVGLILNGNEKASGIYNCTDITSVQIASLFKVIFGLFNKELKPEYLGKQSKYDTLMRYLLLDDTKTAETFGFKPKISLKEGIEGYL